MRRHRLCVDPPSLHSDSAVSIDRSTGTAGLPLPKQPRVPEKGPLVVPVGSVIRVLASNECGIEHAPIRHRALLEHSLPEPRSDRNAEALLWPIENLVGENFFESFFEQILGHTVPVLVLMGDPSHE